MAEGGFDVGNVAAVVISLLSMHCFIPALHLQSLYTYIPLYLIYLYTLHTFISYIPFYICLRGSETRPGASLCFMAYLQEK